MITYCSGDEDNFRINRRDSLSPDSAAEEAAAVRKGKTYFHNVIENYQV